MGVSAPDLPGAVTVYPLSVARLLKLRIDTLTMIPPAQVKPSLPQLMANTIEVVRTQYVAGLTTFA